MRKLLKLILTAPIMVVLISGQILAQENERAAENIDEVIVTARLREESLQDVPLTISAFSGADLDRAGANAMYDIANSVAGFNFEDYPGGAYPSPTIRGLYTNILGFESNISFYYGGVYLPKSYMFDLGTLGIERIEVVKGPQNALYGRNAFAGAVNYVPIAPPEEFLVDAKVTVGTDERTDYGLTVGGPISENASVVAGFLSTEFDGTWSNAHPNANDGWATDGNMGGHDNTSYFVTASMRPSDKLSLLVGYSNWEVDNERQGGYQLSRNTGGTNCSVGSDGVLQFWCGELPETGESTADPRAGGLQAEHDLIRFEASYEINDTWTLNYLFGRIESDAFAVNNRSVDAVNGDTGLGQNFLVMPDGWSEAESHDLRFDYADDDTVFSIGAYISDFDNRADRYVVFPDFRVDSSTTIPAFSFSHWDPNSLPGPGVMGEAGLVMWADAGWNTLYALGMTTEVESNSFYAQIGQDFSNGKYNISAEVRYSDTEKSQINTYRPFKPLPEADWIYDNASWSSVTPRLVFTWNQSDDRSIYASVAKGEKAGGFNGGGLSSERIFEPETNITFELGTKNILADGRMVLNAAVYLVDWEDLQTNQSSKDPDQLAPITTNIGAAESKGFEAEFSYKANDNLSISGTYAYVDAEWDDGQFNPKWLLVQNAGRQYIDACDDISCPLDASIGGNSLERHSKHHASAQVRYEGQMTSLDGASFWLEGNLTYKSKQSIDIMNMAWIPDRTLVHFNAGITNGRYSLETWVRNLLDEEYISSSVFQLSVARENRYQPVYGDKRAIGLTLRYSM